MFTGHPLAHSCDALVGHAHGRRGRLRLYLPAFRNLGRGVF